MADGARLSADAYNAAPAGRQMVLGWRRPRAAMRRAAGIGEGARLALIALSGTIVVLADPAEDGFPRFVAGQVADEATPAASLGTFVLWGVGLLALLLLFYVAVAGALWLFTPPSPTKPLFTSLRSAVAISSWISTLPILVVSLIASLAGLETVAGFLILGLWTAYAGLCLSEAAGLDARAGTGLALGSAVLAMITIAAAIAGLYVTLIREDTAHLVEGLTP